MGPDAKISTANRVRSGGFFGFFQREKFEVVVEMPDTETETSEVEVETQTDEQEEQEQETPASLLELAEVVNEEETEIVEPAISTETESFADVLSRVAFQAHMTSQEPPRPIAIPADPPVIADRPAFLDSPRPQVTGSEE